MVSKYILESLSSKMQGKLYETCGRGKPKERGSLGRLCLRDNGAQLHQIRHNPVKTIWSRKLRKAAHLRRLRSKCSSRYWGQTTKAIGLEAEEGSRAVQAREWERFQIKHPSLLHLMHSINSVYYIQDKMTHEQCPHSL